MNRFWTQAWSVAGSRRDPRVDVLRGISLLMIFVDHIGHNWLNKVTLRNFGFCDAAEIFVLLAGFASMSAYGKRFEREGAGAGLSKVGARCVRLYLYQLGLLAGILLIRRAWVMNYGFGTEEIMPLFEDGLRSLVNILTLRALPPGLDILPLYIILLAVFPLMYATIRLVGPAVALLASGLLWMAVNLHPMLNLFDTATGANWHFNPFAWQFLFTTGAVLALAMNAGGGHLPRRNWLIALCWAYLGVSFLEAAPWAKWSLPNLAPFGMAAPDKTSLAPVRLLDVLALTYLVLSSERLGGLVRLRAFRLIEACGKHSLEVFSLGTLLSLLGQLAMQSFGTDLKMQVTVNVVGFAAMFALAMALENDVRLPIAAVRPVALAAVRQLRR